MPFVVKVEVPDNRNDDCTYKGTVKNAKKPITADIQLCPDVVMNT